MDGIARVSEQERGPYKLTEDIPGAPRRLKFDKAKNGGRVQRSNSTPSQLNLG